MSQLVLCVISQLVPGSNLKFHPHVHESAVQQQYNFKTVSPSTFLITNCDHPAAITARCIRTPALPVMFGWLSCGLLGILIGRVATLVLSVIC